MHGDRKAHSPFQRLESVLGADEAVTFMEHLPSGSYAELAAKQDLVATTHELIAMMPHETRTIVFALVAVVVSIAAVALFT